MFLRISILSVLSVAFIGGCAEPPPCLTVGAEEIRASCGYHALHGSYSASRVLVDSNAVLTLDNAFLQAGGIEANGILRIHRTNLDVIGKIHGNGTLEAWDSTLLAQGCFCIGPHASLVLTNVHLEARHSEIEGNLHMNGGTFSIAGNGLATVAGSGKVFARNVTLSIEQPMALERASEAQFVETNMEPSQIRGDGTARFFRIARLSARTATGEPVDVNATLQSMLEDYSVSVSIPDGEAAVDLLLATYERQSLVTFDPYVFSAPTCSANIISRATLSGEIACLPTGPLRP